MGFVVVWSCCESDSELRFVVIWSWILEFCWAHVFGLWFELFFIADLFGTLTRFVFTIPAWVVENWRHEIYCCCSFPCYCSRPWYCIYLCMYICIYMRFNMHVYLLDVALDLCHIVRDFRKLQHAKQPVERRSHLVRHAREELLLELVRAFQLAHLCGATTKDYIYGCVCVYILYIYK